MGNAKLWCDTLPLASAGRLFTIKKQVIQFLPITGDDALDSWLMQVNTGLG